MLGCLFVCLARVSISYSPSYNLCTPLSFFGTPSLALICLKRKKTLPARPSFFAPFGSLSPHPHPLSPFLPPKTISFSLTSLEFLPKGSPDTFYNFLVIMCLELLVVIRVECGGASMCIISRSGVGLFAFGSFFLIGSGLW